jgi:hypothetical protein
MKNWEKWREAKLQEELDELSQDWDRHVRRLGTEHLEWRCETDEHGRDVYHPVGDTIEGATDFPKEYFMSVLWSSRRFAGQQFEGMYTSGGVSTKDFTEQFGIVLRNSTALAIVDVPYRATVEAVNELLTVKLGRFRQCSSVYDHHKIYYGIAGITLDDDVLKRARELGIGTLRKKGNTVEADTAYARAY